MVVMVIVCHAIAVVAVSVLIFQLLLCVTVVFELFVQRLEFIKLIIDVLVVRQRSLSLASTTLALAVAALVTTAASNAAFAWTLLIA